MAGIGRSKSRNLFQQEENQIDMKAKRLFRQIGIFSALLILIVTHCYATNRKPKILFVVTSHDTKGNTGEKTGYYLGEVSHPWEVLTAAGYEIDFVSPQGENPPVVGFDLNDPVNKKFWEDKYYHSKITHSLKPSQVKPEEYKAIFYAGGNGAMWDLPFDSSIAKIASKIYRYTRQMGLSQLYVMDLQA